MTACRETLERYLNIRSEASHPTTVAHYRTPINSFIDFLRCHYPDLKSFAKVRRVPHVEQWLRSLKEAEPPYTDATREQFILKVRRFLRDIRGWSWPESPSAGLFHRTDLPKRKYTPRPRKPRKPSTRREFFVGDNVLLQLLKRYLDIRGATLRPGSVNRYRYEVLSFIRFL